MWLEEQFPYYELNLDYNCIKGTAYNRNIHKGLNEWTEMREQRENGEITTDEYIEWKLTFLPDTIKLQIIGKNISNCYVTYYERIKI